MLFVGNLILVVLTDGGALSPYIMQRQLWLSCMGLVTRTTPQPRLTNGRR